MLSVGIDEAGRGCIFGPVFAAAVIWNDEIDHPLLKDSKKLSKKQRLYMYNFIKDNAIDYSVQPIDNIEIDRINILQATQKAMHSSLDNLTLQFDHIFVDGNYFKPYKDIPFTCIVQGDSKYKSISAASILAKVEHDLYIDYVLSTHQELYMYKLDTNMGYCTKAHIDAVWNYGKSSFHRLTFKLPFEK